MNSGDNTNKGRIIWIDKSWESTGRYFELNLNRKPEDNLGEWKINSKEIGVPIDLLVKTEQGLFRLSELSLSN